MIYNAEFRDTDDSKDPKGQLYKVVICTNVRDKGPYYWETKPNIKNLQLADDPFIVEYEGEPNMYKPYKCSIATVRIMLEHFERDLLCVKKNDILVMLLKWREEVHPGFDSQFRPVMVNEYTGETLQQYGTAPGEMFYDPRQYDEFCYTVEWIGYTTPSTYSQDYTNILEPFELECQDALSTLQYYDYKVDVENTRSFFDTLVNCLQQIDGVYKHIYVTNSIKVKAGDSRHAIEKLMCLDGNWFDEDGDATDCREVLFQLMQYINCTIVPYHDDLYIINYDAIASEQRIYKRYTRSNPYLIIIDQNVGFDYTADGKVYLGSRFEIDGLKLAGSDTQVSTSSTYKKVKLETSEYYPDSLIPDISDDEQITTHHPFSSVTTGPDDPPMITEVKHPGTSNVEYIFGPAPLIYAGTMIDVKPEAPGSVEVTNYNHDTYDDTASGILKWKWSTATVPNPKNLGEINGANTPDLKPICGCSIVEYGGNQLNINSRTILSDLMQNYNGKRMYWFHMQGISKMNAGQMPDNPTAEERTTAIFTPYSPSYSFYFGPKPELIQPMLKITTNKQLLKSAVYDNSGKRVKSGQHIQLTGNWCFYNTPYFPTPAHWDDKVNDTLKAKLDHMFTWVKIYTTDISGHKKYVQSVQSGAGVNYTYSWKDESQLPNEKDRWCKLFYGGQGFSNSSVLKTGGWFSKSSTLVADSPAFETEFDIVKNNPAVDGTVIPIPEGGDFYGDVTIEFNRPVGCGFENGYFGSCYYAWQATLTDFELNILDDTELDYYRDSVVNSSDSKYEIEMNDFAIDEFPTITSDLSSEFEKSTTLSAVYINANGKNQRVDSISNDGCGLTSLPEKIIINNIASTYKEPKLLLDINLHKHYLNNYITDTYIWRTQFPNSQFVANSLVVDYASDRVKVRLFEKPSIIPQDAGYSNITRNRRRNGDNLFNPIPRKNLSVIKDATQPQLIVPPTMTNTDRDLVVSGAVPGLISDAHIEVNFDTGYAQLSHPNNMNITSSTNNKGELLINY